MAAALVSELLISSNVKRWLKIALLLGIVTVFLTPYDPDFDPVNAIPVTIVFEQAWGASVRVPKTQPEPQAAKRSLHSRAGAHPYVTQDCSIIDITCARRC
jgi:hypothetical protein